MADNIPTKKKKEAAAMLNTSSQPLGILRPRQGRFMNFSEYDKENLSIRQ